MTPPNNPWFIIIRSSSTAAPGSPKPPKPSYQLNNANPGAQLRELWGFSLSHDLSAHETVGIVTAASDAAAAGTKLRHAVDAHIGLRPVATAYTYGRDVQIKGCEYVVRSLREDGWWWWDVVEVELEPVVGQGEQKE